MRDELLLAFGQLLRDHRGERTQADVAASIGISQPSYSAYETGDGLPTAPVLLALIRDLRIPLAEIMALLPDNDDEPNGAQVAA